MHGGYATLLKDVLEDLGMHTELISYTCKCKIGPEGPTGCTVALAPIKITEYCEENLEVHVDTSASVMENAPPTAVQSAASRALHMLLCDQYALIKDGPCLLPRALHHM